MSQPQGTNTGPLTRQKPMYQQLKAIILERIESGRYAPGDRIASENELSREFKVSKHTVIRALTDLVSQGVLVRKQGRGTFVREWREERTPGSAIGHPIAAIMPLLEEDPLLSPATRILAGASGRLESDDMRRSIVFCNSLLDADREAELIETFRSQRPSGLLLYPSYESGTRTVEALQRVAADGIPFVLVDHDLPDANGNFVGTDDHKGAYEAVRHLIERGHRHIAHLTLPKEWFKYSLTVRDRFAGYRRALEEAGIEFDERMLLHRRGEDVGPALDELLAMEPRPTAVFAVDAFTCMQLYRAIRRRGLAIPGDIALVGFDDIEIARLVDVPLTMVRQPFAQIGEVAIECLLTSQPGKTRPMKIRLAPELVVRESSGAHIER